MLDLLRRHFLHVSIVSANNRLDHPVLSTSMYYAFVLVSTIGYGNTNVRTKAGRVFVIAFSIVGIWVFTWLLNAASALIKMRIRALSKLLMPSVQRRSCKRTAGRERWGAVRACRHGRGGGGLAKEVPFDEDAPHCALLCVLCVLYVLAATLLVYAVEQRAGYGGGQAWTVSEAAWFMIVTTTTIGFGDLSPSRSREAWLAMSVEVPVVLVGVVLVSYTLDCLISSLLRSRFMQPMRTGCMLVRRAADQKHEAAGTACKSPKPQSACKTPQADGL
jgi:hypothetical protein